MKIKIWFLLVLAIHASEAMAASYNCLQEGLTDIEIKICRNETISILDDIVSQQYTLLNQNIDAYTLGFISEVDITRSQRAWLLERNRCIDEDCLQKLYLERLSELSELSKEYVYLHSTERLKAIAKKSGLFVDDTLEVRYYYGSEEVIYMLLFGYSKSWLGNENGWCGGESNQNLLLVKISANNDFEIIDSLMANYCTSSGNELEVKRSPQGKYIVGIENQLDPDFGFLEKYSISIESQGNVVIEYNSSFDYEM